MKEVQPPTCPRFPQYLSSPAVIVDFERYLEFSLPALHLQILLGLHTKKSSFIFPLLFFNSQLISTDCQIIQCCCVLLLHALIREINCRCFF
uniref:Putative ovule protein n=1 Tax=Solanum chacoense TaxID=4108 RepID=A0A0V0I1A3_SOLCH